MQKIATQVFICASVLFGILGVIMGLTGIEPDQSGTTIEKIFGKLFITTVFVILSSFALSVAGKYLRNGK